MARRLSTLYRVGSLLLLLLVLLCVTVTISLVRAEMGVGDAEDDAAAMEEFQEAMQAQARTQQNMFTSCVLPKYPKDALIPAGETVDVLVGVSNSEAEDSNHWYRAEYAVAYLYNIDPAFHIQNFTGVAYNRTILPGETATLNYRVRPDPRVEPKDYQLVVQLFYMNERNETFLATPFNSTIKITDSAEQPWDLITVWNYTLIGLFFLALAAVPAWKVWGWLSRKGFLGKSRQRGKKSSGSSASRRGEDLVVNANAELDWSYVPAEHRKFVKDSSSQNKPARAPSPVANKKSK